MRHMLSIADRGKERVLRRRGRENSSSSLQIGEKVLEGGGREAMKGKDIKGVLDLCISISIYPSLPSLTNNCISLSISLANHYISLVPKA